MAMPGAAIQAFCDPVTTRSRPQWSIANGTAPSAEIASTRNSASGTTSRTAPAIALTSAVTPVDVSLWVTRTALRPGIADAACATSAGSGASPHSTSRRVTDAPYTSAIFANRSPNAPIVTASTGSPGDSVLTIAASSPPVPAQVRRMTSWRVPKEGFIASGTRPRSALNSSPRWLTIWRPPASRTEGGRAVGPGIRRLGSKRVTVGWSPRRAAASVDGGGGDGPPSTVVDMTSYDDRPDHDPARRRPPRPPGPARRAPARNQDVGDHRRARGVARRPRGHAGVPVPGHRTQRAWAPLDRRTVDRAA